MPRLIACLLAVVLLAGCTSMGHINESAPLEVEPQGTTAREDAGPSSSDTPLQGEFKEAPLEGADLRIARAGWIKVDCHEEMTASNRMRKAAAKFDATVMAFNDHSVTFKMPSSRLDSLLDVIGNTKGWEIDEFDFGAMDRTSEFYSVEARIESTQAVKARMLKLLENAQTVEDVLEISRKLEDIQARLDGFETTQRDIKLHAGRVDVVVKFD